MAKEELQSDIEELTDEEIIAQGEKMKEALAKKPKVGERTFSEQEVKRMIAQVLKESKDKENEDDEDDEAEKPKIISVARYENKYITHFKNMNTDEMNKEAVIHSVDIEDKKGKRIPWVTIVFDDKTELPIPLETILVKASYVPCELVETLDEDASYDFGKVEKQEVDEGTYSKKGTGIFVKTKATQKKSKYKIKLPDERVVTFSPEVLNWKPITKNK